MDENGEPLVVYHGTGAEFNTFDSSVSGNLFYFSNQRGYAENYGMNFTIGAFLRSKSFLDATSFGMQKITPQRFYEFIESAGVTLSENTREMFVSRFRKSDNLPFWLYVRVLSEAGLVSDLKAVGIDGVRQMEVVGDGDRPSEVIAVIEPNQIKSATGNQGTFSESGDIRFSIAPYGISKEGGRVVNHNPDAVSHWSNAKTTVSDGKEIFGKQGISDGSKLKDILKRVLDWGKRNGLFAEHDTPALGGKVKITRRSIENDLSHGAAEGKIKSVAALPELLRNAVYIQTETNENKPGIKNHILASKLKQNVGNDTAERTVSIVVREQNGNLFYDHEFVENKEGESDDKPSIGVTTRDDSSKETPSVGKVVRNALNVNPDSQINFSSDSKNASQWEARYQDGKIQVNAATVSPEEAPLKVEHEVGHHLWKTGEWQGAFEKLWTAIGEDAQGRIRAAVETLYQGDPAEARFEESQVRALEQIRTEAQRTPQGRNAWDRFVQWLAKAWGQITGRSVPTRAEAEQIAARMLAAGIADLRARNAESDARTQHATGSGVLGNPVLPAPPSEPFIMGKPQTVAGRRLLKKLQPGMQKQGKRKWRVAFRDIIDLVNDAVGVQVRRSLSQTTRKNPAHYRPASHVVMTRGENVSHYAFHEAGHGLLELLREKFPEVTAPVENELLALTRAGDSMASAENVHEGVAEWLRKWIREPEKVQGRITETLLPVIEQAYPKMAAELRDAQRVFQAFRTLPRADQWAIVTSSQNKKLTVHDGFAFHRLPRVCLKLKVAIS